MNLEGILKFVRSYVNKSSFLQNHELTLQTIQEDLFPFTFGRKHSA